MGGIFKTRTISTKDTQINAMRVQQSVYGLCIPLVYGTNRVAANLIWYNDFKATAHTTTQKSGGKGGKTKTKNTTYTYSASIILALSETRIYKIDKVWRDKEQLVNKVENGATLTPIQQLDFELYSGLMSQAPWPYLTSKHPNQALNYRGIGYLAASDFDFGDSAGLSNHNFELQGITETGKLDANPADVLSDFISNSRYGAAQNISLELLDFRKYCKAANLLISPVFKEQRQAFEIINDMIKLLNCGVVSNSLGLIKIVPYADSTISGNGESFIPNLTPIYHLNDNDFLEYPVVKRKRQSDTFNHVKLEYINRFNQYNPGVIEVKDQANIDMFGLKTQETIKAEMFCDPQIAEHVAQLMLQKNVNVLNTYQFTLSFKYCLIEPMDIITITDSSLGLNQFPVRVLSIREDQSGRLDFEAEELAIGSRTAITYGTQSASGHGGFNLDPGNILAPIIFEPPLTVTNGKSEIYIAVAGGENWGGCNVWVSLNGTNYEMVGTINGSARYGRIRANMTAASTTCLIELNTDSQVLSGTAEESQAGSTLCLIGNEYLTYQNAVLTAQRQYSLSGLLRGNFGAPEAQAANARFVRIDKAIFKYEYNPAFYQNKQIYFKFTSFNSLQNNEQTLDQVAAYNYTLVGGAIGSSVPVLQEEFTGKSFTINWPVSKGATSYLIEILYNSVVKRSATLTTTTYTYTNDQAIEDGLGRAYTIRVTPKNGNTSGTVSNLNVANAVPPSLVNPSLSATNNKITATWQPSNVSDFKDYAVWISTTVFTAAQAIARAPDKIVKDPSCIFENLQPATRYYIRVAARDVWADASWNAGANANIVTAT